MKIFALILVILHQFLIYSGDTWRQTPQPIDPTARKRGISQNSIDHMNYAQFVRNGTGVHNHGSMPNTPLYTLLHDSKNCAHWQPNDYWNVIVGAYGWTTPATYTGPIPPGLHAYGYYDSEKYLYFVQQPITEIMHKAELYVHKNFITFIKRFSWYEKELITAYNNLTKNKSLQKKIYHQAINCIKNEYHRIIHKQEESKKQEAEEAITANNFQKNLPCINEMVDELEELNDIAHEYNLTNKDHYGKRLAAINDIAHSSSYKTMHYSLSSDAMGLLAQQGIDSTLYATNYGNQLQQVVHKECVDILSQTARISSQSFLYDYKKSLVNLTDSARAYNQEGSTAQAMEINDFSYALLDYGSAIVEGIACGVIGAAKDMIDHPIQTALCVVAGEYVLAYQLIKLTGNFAKIGITYAFDKEAGAQAWHEYIEPVDTLIQGIKQNKLSVRDGIKMGAAFGTGLCAQRKMFKGLNSFYKTTKVKAINFAKNNPLLTPAEYMATHEGVLLKLTHDSTSNQLKNDLSSSFRQEIRQSHLPVGSQVGKLHHIFSESSFMEDMMRYD